MDFFNPGTCIVHPCWGPCYIFRVQYWETFRTFCGLQGLPFLSTRSGNKKPSQRKSWTHCTPSLAASSHSIFQPLNFHDRWKLTIGFSLSQSPLDFGAPYPWQNMTKPYHCHWMGEMILHDSTWSRSPSPSLIQHDEPLNFCPFFFLGGTTYFWNSRPPQATPFLVTSRHQSPPSRRCLALLALALVGWIAQGDHLRCMGRVVQRWYIHYKTLILYIYIYIIYIFLFKYIYTFIAFYLLFSGLLKNSRVI